MNATLSAPKIDIDALMLKLARNIVMGMHELDDILKNHEVNMNQFMRIQVHPRFQEYLRSEREAWNSATNTTERTKMKAAIVMETFMEEAHHSLHDKKTPLNQRVELGKLLAKIAGMGEPKTFGPGGNAPTFQLQINIAPGQQIAVQPTMQMIEHDPFSSPNTLEDFE